MPEENDFLYFSSVEDAVNELHRRRNDPALLALVHDVLGADVPTPFDIRTPRAVFARHIASPSLEFDYFYKQAKESGLAPLMLETAATKFVAKNWEKYCLARLSFVEKRGGTYFKTAVKRVIDFNADEGKELSTLKTLSGESLVDFHHRLLAASLKDESLEVYDFSSWFLPNRGADRWSYYLRYLQLFLVHGILFENFLLDKKEREFTESVVIPSFRIVKDVFGVPPIIVRTVPKEVEDEFYWCYYDTRIRDLL